MIFGAGIYLVYARPVAVSNPRREHEGVISIRPHPFLIHQLTRDEGDVMPCMLVAWYQYSALCIAVGSHQLYHRLPVVQPTTDGRRYVSFQASAECKQHAVTVAADGIPPRISHRLQGWCCVHLRSLKLLTARENTVHWYPFVTVVFRKNDIAALFFEQLM